MPTDHLNREYLETSGFEGWRAFADLPDHRPPTGNGVYVVWREALSQPEFLAISGAGQIRPSDRDGHVDELRRKWIDGTHILYIGRDRSRTGLRGRLSAYRRHGLGRGASHSGGRHIWQLADRAQLLVAWRTTARDEAADVEYQLIEAFKRAHDGALPFANRVSGRTPRK
ncbi:MAG: hypothetical protein QOC59_173 [Microbacteriaceae bacterium]|nr:hypothetical protein [Microbacteriaceae bacterium]